MNLSSSGKDRIIAREGLRLEAYLDSAGIWTIGVGHTPSHEGERVTKARAMQLLDSDIEWAVNAVNQNVRQQLNQDQFDSLVSLTFNIGEFAFQDSTLLKELNKGRFHLAANQFSRWNKITLNKRKRVSGGLVYRRASELAQWYSILNTKERVCNHRPVSPDGRSATALIKESKTAQGGVAVAGISLMQVEQVTDSVSDLSSTWADLAPMISPYLPYLAVIVGLGIFTRRWYDSRTGRNY